MNSNKTYRSIMYSALAKALHDMCHAKTGAERKSAKKQYNDLMAGLIEYNKKSSEPVHGFQIKQALECRKSVENVE